MTIGVAHDRVTREVVLVDRSREAIYAFAPPSARALASELRRAAAGGCAVLITAVDDAGLCFQLGGQAQTALRMAADIDSNAAIIERL